MELLMIKSVVLLGIISTVFIFGYFKGKKSEQIKQLKNNLKDAKKSKKRQLNRRNDNITTVRKRMQKHVRR